MTHQADEEFLKTAGVPDERTLSPPKKLNAGDVDMIATPEPKKKYKEFEGNPLSGLLKDVSYQMINNLSD